MRVGLFPGQGISAREVLDALGPEDPQLERANDILGYDIRDEVARCAEREEDELPTSLAQPALFIAGLTSFQRALDSGEKFDYLAGHSLGEYTALTASEAVAPQDGLAGVKVRAESMQESSRSFGGGMAVVLKLDLPEVEKIVAESEVHVGNDNAPGQVVLSGSREGLEKARALVKEQKGRWIELKVSGAFHSPAMSDDAEPLLRALEKIEIRSPKIPVVSNVTARPHTDPESIRALLVEQLTSRVRFRESLEWLWDQGVREYEDLGPGTVVAGLARRTFKALKKEGGGADG